MDTILEEKQHNRSEVDSDEDVLVRRNSITPSEQNILNELQLNGAIFK